MGLIRCYKTEVFCTFSYCRSVCDTSWLYARHCAAKKALLSGQKFYTSFALIKCCQSLTTPLAGLQWTAIAFYLQCPSQRCRETHMYVLYHLPAGRGPCHIGDTYRQSQPNLITLLHRKRRFHGANNSRTANNYRRPRVCTEDQYILLLGVLRFFFFERLSMGIGVASIFPAGMRSIVT